MLHLEAMQGSVASTAKPCSNQPQTPLPLHKTSLVNGFGSVTMVLEFLRAQKEIFESFSAQYFKEIEAVQVLLQAVGRAVLRQRGQVGVCHCCWEMATVTVIPEPWEHPCASEQAWEAASGLQVWPWTERSCGLELGVQPGLHLPSCLCFARFTQALGPAFYTPDDWWCQLKAGSQIVPGGWGISGGPQPTMQLPPPSALVVTLCRGSIWDGWDVHRLYMQFGPLWRDFYTPEQWAAPGSSPLFWELWVDLASFPSLRRRTDPGWLRLKPLASGFVCPKGHLPAQLPSPPSPVVQAVFPGTVPWHWPKLFNLNAGWGKDIAWAISMAS